MLPDQTTPITNIYHFDSVDYLVFSSMLIISALTGLYYGCKGKYCSSRKGQTLREYFTGNKSFAPITVALSLIGSHLSGIVILGTPSEIYNFGTQYFIIVLSILISGSITAYVFVPVFFRLRVNSSYEYLELRFHRGIRTIVSFFFILSKVMCLPIIIYAPSLAFNQVTGINTHLIGSVVCVVCIFYTLPGGFKAVVWTDSWQVIIMFLSMLVVVVAGTVYVGGTSTVNDFTMTGKRLILFNFSPNLYDKYTVFSVLLGGCVLWTASIAVNQHMVQKYLSLPNEKQSKLSILMFSVGESLFMCLCCYAGMLAYTAFYGCDPLSLGRIKSDDQILPLFVMEKIGHLKGVPGLFIAGIFSAALSTISVIFNATAQIVYEDFIKGCMRITLTERTAMIVVKSVVLIIGIISLALLFVVEHMGEIWTLTVSIVGITEGTTCGIFILGMVIPWSNSHGAIFGGIAGIIMSAVVSFGSYFVYSAKLLVPHKLPVFVNDSCFDKYLIDRNISISVPYVPDESSVFPLFRLSFLWISTVAVCTVVIVGVITSFITGKTDLKSLDPDLISPVAHWMLPDEAKRYGGSTLRKFQETGKMLEELHKLEGS